MLALEVRATYQAASKETELDVLNRYLEVEYLAVDDVSIGRGDKPESDASLRLAYALFDARYERRLTTDVSTNLLPEELSQRFDERVARRITEMSTVYPMLLPGEA